MPKVLIADDSLSVRKVAERLLTAAGFDVSLAANGEEAVAGFSTTRPDIVIADVIMPDKSGFEVCAHVRSHATLSSTPVLLISGVVDDEITRQAVECRADGVIKKPFHGSSLQDRVHALLASRQEQATPARVESITPVDSPKTTPEAPRLSETPAPVEAAGAPFGPKVFRITEDQLEKVREAATWARDMETRLSEEEKRASDLEEQNKAFRETTILAAARVRELETRLAEEQKRSAALLQRVAEMEHAAACAQKLAEIFAEIGRLGPKAGGS
jgi:DNA-binding response OmpR family regulator